MKKLLGFFILFSHSLFADFLPESVRTSPYVLPGDIYEHQLTRPGVRFTETNDFYGQTDKQITEMGSLGISNIWKHYSYSFDITGRFVQPVLRTRNDRPELEEKLGIYAEWIEAKFNQSYLFYNDSGFLGLKLDLGLSTNYTGNFSFTDLYENIHEALNATIDSDKYGDRLEDDFYSMSYGAGVVFNLSKYINAYVGQSISNSHFMYERSHNFRLIYSDSKDFALSLKYMYIEQIRSHWYEALNNSRVQGLLGLRVFGFWYPSVMYVSSYIPGDKYGQWYMSPLAFSFNF